MSKLNFVIMLQLCSQSSVDDLLHLLFNHFPFFRFGFLVRVDREGESDVYIRRNFEVEMSSGWRGPSTATWRK